MEEKRIKIICGSFIAGCGVVVCDSESDKYYHLVVLYDKEQDKPFIEIKGDRYYLEAIDVKR